MTDLATVTDDQLARLRAIAEDPLIAPSKRVEARKLLKQWREEHEAARDAELRCRLLAKVRSGRDLTWRERAVAQQLGLVAGRAAG